MIKYIYTIDGKGDYMVSGGTVSGDLSSLQSYFSQYDSYMSGLDGSWKGASYDSIKSKSSEFSSSFSSTLQSEMSAFASACELYEKYKQTKTDLENARSNYNRAVSNGNQSDASNYNSQVSNLTSELSSLKTQIQGYLQTASSQKLEATSITASAEAAAAAADGADATNINGKNWADDANFKYFNQSGGWNNYRYSGSNKSNTMGKSGCGPTSMAMVLASLGYNVNPNATAKWSSDHGYHTDGTEEKYFTAYSKELGVNCKVLGKNKNNIKTALQNNELVILHTGHGSYGDFTNNGHYIVARAYDSKTDKVLIADPNRKRNNKWWSLDRVMNQLKGGQVAWSFSKGSSSSDDDKKTT